MTVKLETTFAGLPVLRISSGKLVTYLQVDHSEHATVAEQLEAAARALREFAMPEAAPIVRDLAAVGAPVTLEAAARMTTPGSVVTQ